MSQPGIQINLCHNKGFQWQSRSGDTSEIHVRGFAHIGGEYHDTAGLLDFFTAPDNFGDFTERVSLANGMFSVIYYSGDKAWLAVDRMRSFPLFYYLPSDSSTAASLIISDSTEQLIAGSGKKTLNTEAVTEFLATGYVTGDETLLKGIRQVQAAESIVLSKYETKSQIYSTYRTNRVSETTIEEGIRELAGISGASFKRLAESLQGRCAVLALSGGYDSRFITAMLKILNYPEIICYSYGREGNPEITRAEIIAGKLGLKFIPVVYTDEMISGFPDDPDFHDYLRFSANSSSMFFMQEYFAVKHLKENGLVPADAVFIPGHSGDFLAGSQLIRHGLHDGNEDPERTVRRLLEVKYSWVKPAGNARQLMLVRIHRTLSSRDVLPEAFPYSIHEDWDLHEKISKFIVNSCNVYSWFGYEYRLPLYDYAIQDFFRDLPFSLKAGKQLYDRYLREEVFRSLDLNLEDELQPDEKTQKRAHLKSRIKSILPGSVIPTTLSRKDPIFYYEITRELQADMAQKGVPIRIYGNSYNSLIVQWYIEHLKSTLTSY